MLSLPAPLTAFLIFKRIRPIHSQSEHDSETYQWVAVLPIGHNLRYAAGDRRSCRESPITARARGAGGGVPIKGVPPAIPVGAQLVQEEYA